MVSERVPNSIQQAQLRLGDPVNILVSVDSFDASYLMNPRFSLEQESGKVEGKRRELSPARCLD